MEFAMSAPPGSTGAMTEQPDDADRMLLDRYRQEGDRTALEQLLERHAGVAYRVALRFAGNAADADDVMQDACIGCMASARNFRGTGPVRSWIIAIVANAWRRRARAQRRRRAHEGAAMGPAQPPTEDGSSEELRQRALACLGKLSEHYRLPVTMRYLDGLDYPDIASALGSKENSVRTRVHRGLEQLRSALGHRGAAVGAATMATALAQAAVPPAPAHLPALVQTSLAKGAALPAAKLAAMAVGGTWLTLPVIVPLAVLCTLAAGGVGVWQASQPASSVVAAEPPPVVAMGTVATALTQPISFTFRGDHSTAVSCLRLALPHQLRIPIVGMHANGPIIGGTDDSRLWAKMEVEVDLRDRPLREVLDALCASGGLRWRASSVGIVIDRQMEAQERERLIGEFAQAEGEALASAAQALYRSDDVDCLRPLLRAAAGGGERGKAAATALMPSMDPVIAFSDDPEIRAAVLKAVEGGQEPRAALLGIAGRLRLGAVVEDCIILARAGAASRELADAAMDALGWIGDRRAVDPLLEILAMTSGTPRYAESGSLITALGRIGDPRTVDPLLAIAKDRNAGESNRGAALLAVAEIGEPRAIAPIGNIMLEKTEGNHGVRWSAVHALIDLGGRQAADFLRQEAARGDSEVFLIVGTAMTGLGIIGGPEDEAVLIERLGDRYTGEYAGMALAQRRNPDLIPRLQERLRDTTNEDSYRHIASALSGMRMPGACRALLDTIPAEGSRLMALHLEALTACRSPETMRAIIDLAGRGPVVRKIAAPLLTQCGPEGVTVALRLAEEDPDPEVRMAAISGFNTQWDREEMLPRATLNKWLGHADASIRLAATGLLDHWFPQEDLFLVQALLTASRDADARIRLKTIFCLLNWPSGPQDRPRLLERCWAMAAGDPAVEVRQKAIEVAYFLPSEAREEIRSAADLLVRIATNDAEPRLRAEAWIAAMKLVSHQEEALAKQRRVMAERLKTEADERVRNILAKMLDPANHDWQNTGVDWPGEAVAPVPSSHQPSGF